MTPDYPILELEGSCSIRLSYERGCSEVARANLASQARCRPGRVHAMAHLLAPFPFEGKRATDTALY
jgi:hypothetical protein